MYFLGWYYPSRLSQHSKNVPHRINVWDVKNYRYLSNVPPFSTEPWLWEEGYKYRGCQFDSSWDTNMFLHTDVQKNIYIYHDSTSGGKKTVRPMNFWPLEVVK